MSRFGSRPFLFKLVLVCAVDKPRKGWSDSPLEWVQIVRGRRPKSEQWPLVPGHSQNRSSLSSQQQPCSESEEGSTPRCSAASSHCCSREEDTRAGQVRCIHQKCHGCKGKKTTCAKFRWPEHVSRRKLCRFTSPGHGDLEAEVQRLLSQLAHWDRVAKRRAGVSEPIPIDPQDLQFWMSDKYLELLDAIEFWDQESILSLTVDPPWGGTESNVPVSKRPSIPAPVQTRNAREHIWIVKVVLFRVQWLPVRSRDRSCSMS